MVKQCDYRLITVAYESNGEKVEESNLSANGHPPTQWV